jgi:hypothetical protein
VQSIAHELAWVQSTPPAQPVIPHVTWQGTPAGHTTRPVQPAVALQLNAHTPASVHAAPEGHACAHAPAASAFPASGLAASGLVASGFASAFASATGPSAVPASVCPLVASIGLASDSPGGPSAVTSSAPLPSAPGTSVVASIGLCDVDDCPLPQLANVIPQSATARQRQSCLMERTYQSRRIARRACRRRDAMKKGRLTHAPSSAAGEEMPLRCALFVLGRPIEREGVSEEMKRAGLALLAFLSLAWTHPHAARGTSCRVEGLLPDRACTPGLVAHPSVADVCSATTRAERRVSEEKRKRVFAEYGLSPKQAPGAYEVDHLVPLELGGSNDIANLWPEAAPGFHAKDKVENYLHAQVCRRRMSLEEAQRTIAKDWTSVHVP